MLDFFGLEYTTKDQPGKYSLVLYTSGCNFRCYGCHNRTLAGWDYEKNKGSPVVKNINPEEYHKKLSLEEIKMALNAPFLDMVILCGGEVLIHNLEKVVETINWIKSINKDLLIRIDTNGSFPDKIKFLKEKNIVDGFAIDIKGPYWNSRFYPKISEVIGLPKDTFSLLAPKLMESIHLADGMAYTSFRTVLYPIVEEKEYFDEIKRFVSKLKSPHYFNLFQEV